MEGNSTVANANERIPTDRRLEVDSLETSEYISGDGVGSVDNNSRGFKFYPKSVSPRLAAEESSRPLRALTSATNHAFINQGDPRRTLPRRLGNGMSENQQVSSPSSASATLKSALSRGSSSGNGDEPYLILEKQPPTYAYSNESFQVKIRLQIPQTSSASQSLRDFAEIEVTSSLINNKTGRECFSEALLITQPSRIILSKDKDGIYRCQVTCMIRMDSIQRDQGAVLSVKFRSRPEASPPVRGIIGVLTRQINIVNYKIRITLEDDWGPVWYKDEGGRDKSMEIYAAIYDKEGQLKTGEQIPLCPILCYESSEDAPVQVSNQDILRTLGTSKIFMDKDTGRARIRFRVEDVSKNHQAQDFVLMVGPDPKSKGFKDIAPDYTPAINVRSKRNKRSRTASHSRASSEQSRRTSPAVAPLRYEAPDLPMAFDPVDAPRLREAMRSIVMWADEVINGLYPLQWQVLGYAQHPDGSTDYSRPYHNMPNPNPCINRVLGMYSESVRDSIRLLLSAVDRASPGRSDDPSSMIPVPISVPQVPRTYSDDPMYGMMRQPHPAQMHPTGMPARLDTFAGSPSHDMAMFQGRHPNMMQQHMAMSHMHPYMRGPIDSEMMPLHIGGMLPRNDMAGDLSMHGGTGRLLRPEEESRESEVEFVLAKQYKTFRTGERLGFPAYSANKEILGFYRDQHGSSTRRFSPIARHRNDFGPLEIMQATEILEDAIKKKSEAVHSLKEWGTIENLLNQALVYDWRQDLGNESISPTT